MAASFSLDHAYALAPKPLLEVLSDPAYVEAKMVAIGFTDVSASASGGGVEIHRSTEPPLPGFAKKVLGGKQDIVEIQEWGPADPPTGTFRAAASGTPVKITGTFAIDPDGEGAVLRIRGEVNAGVPLVGGKIAGLVRDETVKTLEKEYAFTQEWIATH